MKRLAIIPARGGSKRIPRKNIRDFCGKPMLAYVVKAAIDSGVFTKIHVSTEDAEIAGVAAAAGAPPEFMRPAGIADDHAPLMAVLRNVLAEYAKRDEHFDTVALLYATCPLMDARDISGACRFFENGKRERPLLSVARYPAPLEWAYRMKENGTLVPDQPQKLSMRSQDMEPAYYEAAMFGFFTSPQIENSEGAGDYGGYAGYEIPSYRVVDIDTPDDWERAEKLYKAITF